MAEDKTQEQDKQYYLKVSFEFGTDVEGVYTPKNKGEVAYNSMPYGDVVLLQHQAVIPGFRLMLDKAGELGLMAAGYDLEDEVQSNNRVSDR